MLLTFHTGPSLLVPCACVVLPLIALYFVLVLFCFASNCLSFLYHPPTVITGIDFAPPVKELLDYEDNEKNQKHDFAL